MGSLAYCSNKRGKERSNHVDWGFLYTRDQRRGGDPAQRDLRARTQKILCVDVRGSRPTPGYMLNRALEQLPYLYLHFGIPCLVGEAPAGPRSSCSH